MDNKTLLNAFFLESLDAGVDKSPEQLVSYNELLARLDLLEWFLKNIYIAQGMMEMKKSPAWNKPNPFHANSKTTCNGIKIIDKDYDKYCDIARSIKNKGYVDNSIIDLYKKAIIKVAYICDRKACKDCSYPSCKYTTDIKHAKYFNLSFAHYEEDDKLNKILEKLEEKEARE